MVKEVSKMRVLFRDKLPSKTTETLCDTGGDPSALESLTRYHLLVCVCVCRLVGVDALIVKYSTQQQYSI